MQWLENIDRKLDGDDSSGESSRGQRKETVPAQEAKNSIGIRAFTRNFKADVSRESLPPEDPKDDGIGLRAFSRNLGAAPSNEGRFQSSERVAISNDFENFTAKSPLPEGAQSTEGWPIPIPLHPHSSILVEPELTAVATSFTSSRNSPPIEANGTAKGKPEKISAWKSQIKSMAIAAEPKVVLDCPSSPSPKCYSDRSTQSSENNITQQIRPADETLDPEIMIKSSSAGIIDSEVQDLKPSAPNSLAIISLPPESQQLMLDPSQAFRVPRIELPFAKDDDNFSNIGVNNLPNRSIDVSANMSMESPIDDESEDYKLESPLPSWNKYDDERFDPSLNCEGVLHVRLLRAQRLPCSVGSNIYAFIALPPWKGRVRAERTNAYRGPSSTGVCVRWDELNDSGCYSMLHQWNNEDTPIPTITVDLMFSPLQMIDFNVCSLKLSCKPLMRSPGEWTRKWLRADLPPKLAQVMDSSSFGDDPIPLIQLEAVFIPASIDENMPEDAAVGSVKSFPLISGLPTSEPTGLPKQGSRAATSVTSSQFTPRNPTRSHLLAIESFWTPAYCSVCSKLLTGWKRAYRCEVCNIDCCNDCQLQVDIQIPCGSIIAKGAFKNAFQNQMSMRNMLSIIAPETSKATQEPQPSFKNTDVVNNITISSDQSLATETKNKQGVGSLRLNIVKGCIFDRPFAPDFDPGEILNFKDSRALRQGDHYVRISWIGSKESTRTRLVQNTGKPRFDTEEMKFVIPHYGMEYKIEIIDAGSNKSVGTTLLPVQALLQWQRDWMIEEKGWSYFQLSQLRKDHAPKRRMTMELRTGVKSGFSADYFVSPKTKERVDKSAGKTRAGEIIGWIEIDVCVDEDIHRLYGSNPFECPPIPPNAFNVDMFQVHIARLVALVGDIKNGAKSYEYLISWNDPALTGLSLIVFVTICLRFNTEYTGSLPISFLIAYMLHLAMIRRRGDLKNRFIRRAEGARVEAEKKASVKYPLHRPIARVEISVCRGKNIVSTQFGFAGSVGCRIYWDPLRYEIDQKVKDEATLCDNAVSRPHDIAVVSNQFSKHPVWNDIVETKESMRINQLLPDHGSFFETSEEPAKSISDENYPSIQYPLLQPIVAAKKSAVSEGDQAPEGSFRLLPWRSSNGAIVVEVRFHDVLNNLPGFEDVLGEISIPISKLVEAGEIKGWFEVLEAGSKAVVPCNDDDDNMYDSEDVSGKKTPDKKEPKRHAIHNIFERPKVYIHLRWKHPESDISVSDTDREVSIVIAEEMIKSAFMSAQESKVNFIGSSIGAFNTVYGLGGNIQFIQNTLGALLDIVEKIRNAFNFSDPLKSTAILLILVIIWLFLALVPTRTLVLVGGVAQYVVTFIARFGLSPLVADSSMAGESRTMPSVDERDRKIDNKETKDPFPFLVWATNAFRALPTDEDLRKAYFWESRRIAEQECEKLASKKRASRLQRLWKAEWYASAELKVMKEKGSKSDSGRDWDWVSIFAMIQNRRFLWWQDVRDFDNGEAPLGRIFLAGHAGLAGLSPLDQRELREDEIPLVTSIFGRGMEEQQKLILLMPASATKDHLENSVIAASTKAD